MKTNTLAAICILLTVVTLGSASTEKAGDRPPGIAANQWFPISDRLGLVISDYQPGLDPLIDNGPIKALPPATSTVSPPPVVPKTTQTVPTLTGYLMIKQGGHWSRLSVVSPPACPPGMEGNFCVETVR